MKKYRIIYKTIIEDFDSFSETKEALYFELRQKEYNLSSYILYAILTAKSFNELQNILKLLENKKNIKFELEKIKKSKGVI